ncbi:hypothetical protein BOTBODRAFT_33672 [Botryobasidium botryosum FD-172 SS1]|uniref:Uncharacterized protein n=1 Tax=Botryobasidium botryosum (strain FD-172 SS1) TaxID=930990 RepID=A0A067MP60_BOTB1|nr:hypothetical protein BOTBODRAFT_33672 [Botryobasidium botryosum FD-172 SS1]
MSSGCVGIVPNPDIAGIGVRVSVYTQAFLSLLYPIIFFADGMITRDEAKSMGDVSSSILLTGCALLVSAFIQAATFGLSVYHVLIVLNLSWINSTSCFLYECVMMRTALRPPLLLGIRNIPRAVYPRTGMGRITALHIFAMAALGIWVWNNVAVFGDQPECTPQTVYVLFGKSIPVDDKSLRISSIVVYAHSTVSLGLGVLRFAALAPQVLMTRLRLSVPDKAPAAVWFMALFIDVIFVVDTEVMIRRNAGLVQAGESQWTFGQTLAMLVLVAPLVDLYRKVRGWRRGERDPFLEHVGGIVRWPIWAKDDDKKRVSAALKEWEQEGTERMQGEERAKTSAAIVRGERSGKDLLRLIRSVLGEWERDNGFRGWKKTSEALERWEAEGFLSPQHQAEDLPVA